MNRLCILRILFTGVLISLCTFCFNTGTAADDGFAATIEQRVRDWQPTREERLLDQVGWASDLVQARRLAQEHGRPLFVFTYDGSATRANAIALQRC